ncbi:MAG: hypothetical protein AAF694_09905 [Bacteroidota bacterium]
MKRLTLAFVCVSMAFFVQAQDSGYEQVMKETAAKWEGFVGPDEALELANTYERIGKVASKEWLPRYYAAHMYIVRSFNVEEGKDDILDKAQEHLDAASNLGGDESEIAALQSFLHLGRLVVNTMVRGMTYSGKVVKAAEKAIELNEANPRGHYILAMYYEGMPKFIGGGMDAACPHYQAAKESFDAYKPVSELHPTWGKDSTLEKVGKCSSN